MPVVEEKRRVNRLRVRGGDLDSDAQAVVPFGVLGDARGRREEGGRLIFRSRVIGQSSVKRWCV